MERLLSPRGDEHLASLHRRYVEKDVVVKDSDDGEKGAKSDPWGEDYRTPQQKDRDRILYSTALQRLAYVTQVTAPEAGHAFHNRLGHSLKVAQVGRRNAERLKALAADKHIAGAAATLVESVNPDAVEASCLGHDPDEFRE